MSAECRGDSVVVKAEEPDSEGWYPSAPLTSRAIACKLHGPHDSVSPSVKWKRSQRLGTKLVNTHNVFGCYFGILKNCLASD